METENKYSRFYLCPILSGSSKYRKNDFYPINKNSFTIGRSRDNDLHLDALGIYPFHLQIESTEHSTIVTPVPGIVENLDKKFFFLRKFKKRGISIPVRGKTLQISNHQISLIGPATIMKNPLKKLRSTAKKKFSLKWPKKEYIFRSLLILMLVFQVIHYYVDRKSPKQPRKSVAIVQSDFVNNKHPSEKRPTHPFYPVLFEENVQHTPNVHEDRKKALPTHKPLTSESFAAFNQLFIAGSEDQAIQSLLREFNQNPTLEKNQIGVEQAKQFKQIQEKRELCKKQQPTLICWQMLFDFEKMAISKISMISQVQFFEQFPSKAEAAFESKTWTDLSKWIHLALLANPKHEKLLGLINLINTYSQTLNETSYALRTLNPEKSALLEKELEEMNKEFTFNQIAKSL